MINPANQTSQITPNWNKKHLIASKEIPENLSFKLLCDVICSSLPGKSDIPCFTTAIFL